MRILWYVLTFFLGLIGLLGALRTVELFLTGAGLQPLQLCIAIVALVLAVVCLRNARTA